MIRRLLFPAQSSPHALGACAYEGSWLLELLAGLFGNSAGRRPRNLMIFAAAVSTSAKGFFSQSCPTATRAQYPRSGVGIFARRHALARPTSDMPNRFDRVRVDSDQTSLYSASRVKVRSGLRLSGRFAEGMGACSSVFEDIAVTRDANSTTFLPCLSSALCRSFV